MDSPDTLSPIDLAAIGAAIGADSVTHVVRITGGQSATTDVVETSDGRGDFVMRRHGAWAAEHDPDVAQREGMLLRELGEGGFPVPEVLWIGELSGRPAIITSLVPGAIELNPADQCSWARHLASTLITLHGFDLSTQAEALLRSARSGPADSFDRQRVAGHRRGEQLLARQAALVLTRSNEPGLIHGDYHPGNILWAHGRVSAVLDWEASRLGDPAADVAYCATELRLLSLDEAATTFVDSYSASTGGVPQSLSYWTATALCRSIGEIEGIVESWGSSRPEHALERVRNRRDAMIEHILDLETY